MASNTDYITTDISFHPGEDLAEKLQEMDMSIKDFAEKSHVSEDIVQGIIDGDKSITLDIAIAFEAVTGIPAKMWIRSQYHYDEYILSQKRTSYMERLESLFRIPRNAVAML